MEIWYTRAVHMHAGVYGICAKCNAKCMLFIYLSLITHVSLSFSYFFFHCIFFVANDKFLLRHYHAHKQIKHKRRHIANGASALFSTWMWYDDSKDGNVNNLMQWRAKEMVEQLPINRRNAVVLVLSFNLVTIVITT